MLERKNARDIFPPTGPELNAKNWQAESLTYLAIILALLALRLTGRRRRAPARPVQA